MYLFYFIYEVYFAKIWDDQSKKNLTITAKILFYFYLCNWREQDACLERPP
jgi:hypothetical protein